jgi:hypothetical protein
MYHHREPAGLLPRAVEGESSAEALERGNEQDVPQIIVTPNAAM